MELFNVLNPNMFGLLTSKNRDIYLSSLFVLRKSFLQEFNIEKEKLINQISSHIENNFYNIEVKDDTEDENSAKTYLGREPRNFASFIVKKFEETGWIESEYNKTAKFKENIMLPPYSVKLLNTLYEIDSESETPYTAHVFKIYSSLYSADTGKSDFLSVALFNAYDEMLNLLNALKVLNHDLRRRYRKITSMTSSSEILAEHFDDYQKKIVEDIFVPLKTKDSVSRFKGLILEILIRWMRSPSKLEAMGQQSFLSGRYQSIDEAKNACFNTMQKLSEGIEEAQNLLDEIDDRNTTYISTVTQKIKHLLNTNKTSKRRLSSIITRFATAREQIFDFDKISNIIGLDSQGYINEASLFVRAAGERIEYSEPAPIDLGEDTQTDSNTFIEDSMNSPYTSKNVVAYLDEIMADKSELKIEDWNLNDDKELIRAIIATIRGHDNNVFYTSEVNGASRVKNNRYTVPETTFRRRKG